MKIFLLISIFILTACSSTNVTSNKDFGFSKNMSIDDFSIKLRAYANSKPYPNIND